MSQNNNVIPIDPNLLESLKEKFTIPKATIPSAQELNLYSRLQKVEQMLGLHEERIATNLAGVLENADKAQTAARTALNVQANLQDAAKQLSSDSSEIDVAGKELQTTIQNEVKNIEQAFTTFGEETSVASSSVAGSISALGGEFSSTVKRLTYPLQVIQTYANRFKNDGIIYMPYNGYVCFVYGFVNSNSVMKAMQTSFGYLNQRTQAVSSGFNNFGEVLKNSSIKLQMSIDNAIININAALEKFLNRFGALGKNLATKLNI